MSFVPDAFSWQPSPPTSSPMTTVHEDLLFCTEKGDICLRLLESWPQLLADTSVLGPVLLLSRTEQVVVASRVARTEFFSTGVGDFEDPAEMVELTSGFTVNLANLHFVVAADERLQKDRMLALQFFDRHGEGLFKVILADGAEHEWFTHFIQHYARGGSPPRFDAQPPLPAPGALAHDSAGLDWLRAGWRHQHPTVQGDYMAGWEDMVRHEAMELIGAAYARPARYEALVQSLFLASREQIPLRISLFNQGLFHQIDMTPQRMERCGDSIHLMDRDSEAHILRAPGLGLWQKINRQEHGVCLELYGSDRRRCCHIQCVGEPLDVQRWSEIFLGGDV